MQGLRRIKTQLALSLVTAVTLLSACSGGGSVNLGSGQTADPATVDFPIAYVKRTIPTRADDLHQRRDALPDADLWVRDRASPSAPERNVTERITGTDRWDVKDVDVSTDGKRFIFAMRGPLAMNQDEEDPPTWGIWEYVLSTDELRRVIVSDTIAAEGNDISPHYLPDGRIAFSSTRQRQSKAILLDEGKPGFEAQTEVNRSEPAFVLHVMNADGSNIHQITFNQSHDVDATVLSNGRLMYSRWDGADRQDQGIHLYTTNPDGTDTQLLYGAQSHATGTNNSTVQFVRAREMQNGRVLALIRPADGTDIDFGGDLVVIDTQTYVENTQPTLANAGMPGPAQTRATPNDVHTIPGPSPGGRFSSAFPLWDGSNRILVSWTQCRLLENGAIVPCTATRLAATNPARAAVLYSVWMFDPTDNTLKPVMTPVEGTMVTDVAAAQPRTLPAVILDGVPGLGLDATLASEGAGLVNIRTVYDTDGIQATAPSAPNIAALAQLPAPLRPARFLRLEKPVSMPDDDVLDFDNAAFGATQYMREILGYVPIEPDGSVVVRVPANVAFQMSIVDSNGRRLYPLHRNWLQVRPGETLKCNGCHNANTTPVRSHGRSGLFASAYAGAATTGVPFPGTDPVFSPDAGDTMAETRARNDARRSTIPSMEIKFEDVWTNPATAGRAKDASFTYGYSAPDFTTQAPTNLACITAWSSTCRTVINYVRHIEPVLTKPRVTLAADMVTVLTDLTCTRCHNKVDTANANAAQVPAASLDLTTQDSNVEPLRKEAYQQLLFARNELELVGGAVVPRVVTTIGPDGQPQQNNATLPPPMAAGNARGSVRFFDRFAAGGTHASYLTPAELRLLSEWVDIGAQYFNNPFDPAVPLN